MDRLMESICGRRIQNDQLYGHWLPVLKPNYLSKDGHTSLLRFTMGLFSLQMLLGRF